MCGIAGIIGVKDYNADTATKLIQSIKHRGPDDDGYWFNSRALLVQTRLSIIDLSINGKQPFFDDSKEIVCVFNGEIYNFLVLREIVIEHKFKLKGHSDGELIPFLYKIYGVDFISYCKGMFSICIYDNKINKTYLYRDRLGIKPLYYTLHNNLLRFGSELNSILFAENTKIQIDYQAIYDYLSLSFIPEPLTGFKNIYAVEPGHYLIFDGNSIIDNCYWNPKDIKRFTKNEISFSNARQNLNNALADSIKSQLIADVPIGAFLSGGIDSTAVALFASKQFGNDKLNTFTVKFGDKEYDESVFAAETSVYLNTNHTELNIDNGSINIDLINSLLTHFSQPFGDSSMIPTYLISKKIREHVKVALSGDGGDEILGGYETFTYYKKLRFLKKFGFVFTSVLKLLISILIFFKKEDLSRKINRIHNILISKKDFLLFGIMSYINESEKKAIFTDTFNSVITNENILQTGRLYELKTTNDDNYVTEISEILLKTSLSSDMLKKVDMMSMLNGIEVRVPLLDDKIVELALSYPSDYKINKNKGKFILREIIRGKIPDSILKKKKTGFSIPIDKSLDKDSIDIIYQALTNKDSLVTKLIKKDIIKEWLDAFTGKINLEYKLSRYSIYQRVFILYSLELWLQRFETHFKLNELEN